MLAARQHPILLYAKPALAPVYYVCYIKDRLFPSALIPHIPVAPAEDTANVSLYDPLPRLRTK